MDKNDLTNSFKYDNYSVRNTIRLMYKEYLGIDLDLKDISSIKLGERTIFFVNLDVELTDGTTLLLGTSGAYCKYPYIKLYSKTVGAWYLHELESIKLDGTVPGNFRELTMSIDKYVRYKDEIENKVY